MKSNLLEDFKLKFFKPGNPAMQYIGIHICVFVGVFLVSIIYFLMGNKGSTDSFFNQYFAFPGNLARLPFRFYTLVTYAFLHNHIFMFLFNMLWLYWTGQIFMGFLRARQFHVVYWGGILSGAVVFLALFNLLPAFKPAAGLALLTGSTAATMAIFTAVATLVPNYGIRLLFLGEIKLKWLLLIYMLISLFTTTRTPFQMGVSLSNFGGVLFGFIFIKLLQNGIDLSTLFKTKPRLKVVKKQATAAKKPTFDNQVEIDQILDKISKSGYEKLTAQEKRTLFDASKN